MQIQAKVAMKDMGAFDPTVEYKRMDKVSYLGSGESVIGEYIYMNDTPSTGTYPIHRRSTNNGVYSQLATYYKGNVITFNNTEYLYINDVPESGKVPLDREYWKLFDEGTDDVYWSLLGIEGKAYVTDTSRDLHRFMFTTIKSQFDRFAPRDAKGNELYDMAPPNRPMAPAEHLDRNQAIRDGNQTPIMKPTIIFTIDRREYGTASGQPMTGAPKSLDYTKTKEGKPFKNNEAIYTQYVKFYDNKIKFSCLANTQAKLWELVEWFELFMEEVASSLKKDGFLQMWYLYSEEDDSQYNRNRIFCINIFYYIRTARVKFIRKDKIKEIDINTEMGSYEFTEYGIDYGNTNTSSFAHPLGV
jgi:hypothetical protein